MRAPIAALLVALTGCSAAGTEGLQGRDLDASLPTDAAPRPDAAAVAVDAGPCAPPTGVQLLPEGTGGEPPLVVVGARVIAALEGRAPGGAGLVTIEPSGQAVDLTARGRDDRLVDALGDQVVLTRAGMLLELRGGVERELAPLQPGGLTPLGQQTQRVIGAGFIAWHDRQRDAVLRLEDGRLTQVSEGLTDIVTVDVRRTTLAFLADEGRRLVVDRSGELVSFDLGPMGWSRLVRIVGDDVYWATNQGLMRLAGAALETVTDLLCWSLAGTDDTLLAACGTGPGEADLLVRVNRGGLAVDELEAPIAAVALSDRRIAWVLQTDDGCSERGPGRGTLKVWDRAGVVLHTELVSHEVGGPCSCCNAYWPQPYLALSDDVVAWNYALPSANREPLHAYQRLSSSCGE